MGIRARPVGKADNLTVICEPIGILGVSQTHRPPWPVTGVALFDLFAPDVISVELCTAKVWCHTSQVVYSL
jgi:hypothetical protein